ncbi:MAG TPA: DNA double-strand break repair nuclease NurA [Acidimicrobiales bacterium]|nr:DNA double-strand break repair nuclease NurA [Acidimicrobiales bacterium]
MADPVHTETSIDQVGARLISLLTSPGGGLRDPSDGSLVFEPALSVRPLSRAPAPPAQAWAVDGGQALVADARCLQVYVTRAAQVCWAGGRAMAERALPLQAALLGLGEEAAARAALIAGGAPLGPDCTVDVNLLREWGEWSAARAAVLEAEPGALVLVDGDLQPDWRLAPEWMAGLLDLAADRRVTLMGVTKHTSLSWGGAPLLGVLERLAPSVVGARDLWWAPVARTSPSVGPGTRVVVARLDPAARFAFRVDLPGTADPEPALGLLATLCDDAAFPGYPYPLSSADRMAACPGWVREEVWSRIDDMFDRAGVPADLRDRAFADRHRLMERS